MKLFFLSLASLCTSCMLQGQAPASINTHKQVFIQCLQAGDFPTAIQAANYIIATDNKSSYRDSLAILYYNTANLAAAAYWADRILAEQPRNAPMAEVKALCLRKSGDPVAAIGAFEQLLKLKYNPVYAYELMQLQYNTKRLIECVGTGRQALQVSVDSSIMVSYTIENKVVKQTPLKAAIYNTLGLALADLQKIPEAVAAFQSSLVLDKEYVPALKNLELAKLPGQNPEMVKEKKRATDLSHD
jgi:tetratricopeptide (TPR) repeat protein